MLLDNINNNLEKNNKNDFMNYFLIVCKVIKFCKSIFWALWLLQLVYKKYFGGKNWAGKEGFLTFYWSLAWIGHERFFKPVYASYQGIGSELGVTGSSPVPPAIIIVFLITFLSKELKLN